MDTPLPPDLSVLVRGWLHGNCVVVAGGRPALVDTGYHSGADELVAFAGARLGSVGAVERVLLTHVHSDHAGGTAAIVAAAGARPPVVSAHVDALALVRRWDTRALWLDLTHQELPRFVVDHGLNHGERVEAGGRTWTVIHTPGHATGGVSFLDEADGVLITGDALWEDGFGLLDPWVDGPGVFAEAALALDRLASLRPAVVVPGHGRPFTDLAGAVARARSRLAYLEARPDRLRAQIVRNFVGFLILAHEGWGQRELLAATVAMAEARAPLAGDRHRPGAEALAREVLASTGRALS